MAETGETYTQASRVLDTVPRDSGPTRQNGSIRSIVANLVEADLAYASLLETEQRRLEAAGYRLIGGGQTDGEFWEITDGQTGEVLVEGGGGIAGYDAAADRLASEGKWFHVDQIKTPGVDPFDVAVDQLVQQGLPRGLVEAIGEWTATASDEELESYLGSSTAGAGRR